jgi:hypothetical protein
VLHCIAFVAFISRATKEVRVQRNATKPLGEILLNLISAVSAEFRESHLIQLLYRFDIDSFRDAAPGLG